MLHSHDFSLRANLYIMNEETRESNERETAGDMDQG